jgi:hypothetical protein
MSLVAVNGKRSGIDAPFGARPSYDPGLNVREHRCRAARA